MPIKIFGPRYLNRAMHLDRVYVKLCDWSLWGVANQKTVLHINFNEVDEVREYLKRIRNEKGEEFQIDQVLDSIRIDNVLKDKKVEDQKELNEEE